MTDTTAPIDQVVDLLRQLHLPHMRRQAPDVLATAKAQRWDPAEAVRALLTEELAGRRASSINIRRTAAGFPTGKTFDTWDQTVSSIPTPTQRSLTTLEWIDRHENLVVCGPSGTGKTHLLEALGHAAIGHGCHVQWFSLETLGALINRHRVDDSTSRAIKKIMRADLICIDLCRPGNYAERGRRRRWRAGDSRSDRGCRVGIVPVAVEPVRVGVWCFDVRRSCHVRNTAAQAGTDGDPYRAVPRAIARCWLHAGNGAWPVDGDGSARPLDGRAGGR